MNLRDLHCSIADKHYTFNLSPIEHFDKQNSVELFVVKHKSLCYNQYINKNAQGKNYVRYV